MSSTTMQNDVLGMEKKYWDAMKKNDVDAAVSLTKFSCILTGPMGLKKVSEPEYRKMMSSANADTYKNVEMENPQVDFLSQDTAIVSYSIQHNGKKMLDVSTWVRDNGKWVCAYHAENPVQ